MQVVHMPINVFMYVYMVYVYTVFTCAYYAYLQADAYVTCDTFNFEMIHCITYLYVMYEL